MDLGLQGVRAQIRPERHCEIGECLVFVLVKTAIDIPEREMTEVISEVLDRQSIRSFSGYQLLGDESILLKLWIPSGISISDLDDGLRLAAGNRFRDLVQFEYMEARELIFSTEHDDLPLQIRGEDPPNPIGADDKRELLETLAHYNLAWESGDTKVTPRPAPAPSDTPYLHFDVVQPGIKFICLGSLPFQFQFSRETSIATRRMVTALESVNEEADIKFGAKSTTITCYRGFGGIGPYIFFAQAPSSRFYEFYDLLRGNLAKYAADVSVTTYPTMHRFPTMFQETV